MSSRRTPIDPDRFTLSVVVPVYNERDAFPELLPRVLQSPYRKEVLVVDDCSQDGSRDLVQRAAEVHPEVRALFHRENRGKGAALRTGFDAATGDVVLVQDADLEYDPSEYPRLLEPILDGRADVVYGSRFLGGPHRVMFFWHMIGNQVLTLYSNMLTNLNLTDMETCYKVFRREVLGSFRLESDRFGFEPEVTARVAKGNFRVYEVPISYSGRDYREGKKITWKDGVAALWHITKFNLLR
jgi:glycosyltransferase involved in cell wall biosynthesis